jgi:HK97 family phage portal protein
LGFFDFLKSRENKSFTTVANSNATEFPNLNIKGINGQIPCNDPKTIPCDDNKCCESSIQFIGIDAFKTTGSNISSINDYVSQCPPIAGILGKKTQCFLTGQISVTNLSGKCKGKEVDNAKSKYYRKILEQPNYIQTQAQFLAQIYAYTQLTGYCVVFGIRPYGFSEFTSLWVLPSDAIDIKFKRTNFFESENPIEKITYRFNGANIPIPLDDIIIIKDNSVVTTQHSNYMLPNSRLKPIQKNINNIIIALNAQQKLLRTRGALGILSNTRDAAGISNIKPEEKELLQKEWANYGIRDGQSQIIITNAALNWQQISLPTKDLMLFEGVQNDVKMICDVMDYPYHLLPYASEGTTFNNVAESGKLVYQNTIIPEAKSIFEQINYLLGTEGDNLIINYTFDHLPFLQKNIKEEAEGNKAVNEVYETLWAQGLCTRNEWLTALGKPTIEVEEFNKIIFDLPKSSQPLAVTIGVGGTQALIQVLTSAIPEDAKIGALEVLFGIEKTQAQKMVLTNNNN